MSRSPEPSPRVHSRNNLTTPTIRRPVLRYTEAFGGVASVLMQKPRSHAEIYNDLDGEVVNVFRVLQVRARARRLEELLRVTPFARDEFEKSYLPVKNEVERARRTIMRSFLGFASDSVTRVKATSAGFNSRISTMRTGFRVNSWRSNVSAACDWCHYWDALRFFCERLQGVVIENRDALKIIAKADRHDTLHYVDPPYPRAVRNSGCLDKRVEHNYRHELTEAGHEDLAALLHSLKGMVIISSYPGELYRRLYGDWHSLAWSGQQFCHGSQKRTETVWLNDAAWRNMPQQRMAFEAAQ